MTLKHLSHLVNREHSKPVTHAAALSDNAVDGAARGE